MGGGAQLDGGTRGCFQLGTQTPSPFWACVCVSCPPRSPSLGTGRTGAVALPQGEGVAVGYWGGGGGCSPGARWGQGGH